MEHSPDSEENYYETILRNVPFIAFSLDTRGRVLKANKYTEDTLGLKLDDHKGKPFNKVIKIRKRELLKIFIEFRKNLAGKVTGKTQYKIELPDGRKKKLEIIGIPLKKDGKVVEILDIGEDVTAKEEMTEKLRKSEALLNSIIDQSPNSTWISDDRGVAIRMNRACYELFKITPEEVIGKYSLFTDNILEKQGHMPLVKDVFKKCKIAKFKIEYDTAALENVPLEKTVKRILDVTIFPIKDEKGKVTNAVVQHNDITEQHEMHRQLEEKVEELEKFKDLTVGRELRMVELKNKLRSSGDS